MNTNLAANFKCNICDETVTSILVEQHVSSRNHSIKKKVAEYHEMNAMIKQSSLSLNQHDISVVNAWIRDLYKYDFLSTGRTQLLFALYGVGYYASLFIIQATEPHMKTLMVCDKCGHPNDQHKAMTFSMFYCHLCKSVESSISFLSDNNLSNSLSDDPSKSNDAITDILASVNGIRRQQRNMIFLRQHQCACLLTQDWARLQMPSESQRIHRYHCYSLVMDQILEFRFL